MKSSLATRTAAVTLAAAGALALAAAPAQAAPTGEVGQGSVANPSSGSRDEAFQQYGLGSALLAVAPALSVSCFVLHDASCPA